MAVTDRIGFSCTALAGTNKVGNLKRDADGYYEVVLGALDVYNHRGQYWPATTEVREMFKQSSRFMRRISRAALRCEYGHPKKEGGMNMKEYAHRLTQIWEHMVCCHIKEVWLETSRVKDPSGRVVIAIMGKIRPSATPYGLALEKQLQNPHENVCFSIRAVTGDIMERGRYDKHIKEIITWDYVNEPGIAAANKYCAPSLESIDAVASVADVQTLEEVSVPVAMLETYVHAQRNTGLSVSMESADDVSLSSLVAQFRAETPKLPSAVRPKSTKW